MNRDTYLYESYYFNTNFSYATPKNKWHAINVLPLTENKNITFSFFFLFSFKNHFFFQNSNPNINIKLKYFKKNVAIYNKKTPFQ